MPLFLYRCQKCEEVAEAFVHCFDDVPELVCKCGCEDFDKVIGHVHSKITYNANDTYQKRIAPSVDKIQEKLAAGNDNTFLDIAGDN